MQMVSQRYVVDGELDYENYQGQDVYEDSGPSELLVDTEIAEQQLERSQRAIIAGHRRVAFDAVDRAMDAVRRIKERVGS